MKHHHANQSLARPDRGVVVHRSTRAPWVLSLAPCDGSDGLGLPLPRPSDNYGERWIRQSSEHQRELQPLRGNGPADMGVRQGCRTKPATARRAGYSDEGSQCVHPDPIHLRAIPRTQPPTKTPGELRHPSRANEHLKYPHRVGRGHGLVLRGEGKEESGQQKRPFAIAQQARGTRTRDGENFERGRCIFLVQGYCTLSRDCVQHH